MADQDKLEADLAEILAQPGVLEEIQTQVAELATHVLLNGWPCPDHRAEWLEIASGMYGWFCPLCGEPMALF